jgi:hypothetical protein
MRQKAVFMETKFICLLLNYHKKKLNHQARWFSSMIVWNSLKSIAYKWFVDSTVLEFSKKGSKFWWQNVRQYWQPLKACWFSARDQTHSIVELNVHKININIMSAVQPNGSIFFCWKREYQSSNMDDFRPLYLVFLKNNTASSTAFWLTDNFSTCDANHLWFTLNSNAVSLGQKSGALTT